MTDMVTLAVGADSFQHDWSMTVKKPVYAWWDSYPSVKSDGELIIVPCEVGEVLFHLRIAVPYYINNRRSCIGAGWWNHLPWVADNLVLGQEVKKYNA